jgi:hypothetical protein
LNLLQKKSGEFKALVDGSGDEKALYAMAEHKISSRDPSSGETDFEVYHVSHAFITYPTHIVLGTRQCLQLFSLDRVRLDFCIAY